MFIYFLLNVSIMIDIILNKKIFLKNLILISDYQA